jgi:hypothetical protein
MELGLATRTSDPNQDGAKITAEIKSKKYDFFH